MRVVIADDTALVRSGVAAMLTEAGIETVGEAGDADRLLALVAEMRPDAAVVDIRMPPTHTDEGLVAAVRIRAHHPDVGVLVLSQHVDSAYALRLVEQSPGGVGYLLKDRVAHAATLVDALNRIVGGECLVDPAIVARLLARARASSPLDALTDREREVLALMAQGRANSSICRDLGFSTKTLETHVSRIFAKLGLAEETGGHRRVLAVLTFLRHG